MLRGKSRLVMAAIGLILCFAYVQSARGITMPVFADPVGPRFVPYLFAAGMAICCVALVIEHLLIGARESALAASTAGEDQPPLLPKATLVVLPLLAAYLLAFERLGFIVASAIFLFAVLAVTNRGRWRLNVLLAILFPIGVYLVLNVALGARLPAGILAFL